MDQLGDKNGKYGGSIRESGGAFGSMAAARENEYFRKLDEQKLDDLKKAQENKTNKTDDHKKEDNK